MEISRSASVPVRDTIVTLFGLYGRGDAALPISQIVTLIGTVGADEQSVRSSVSRMKTRGLLEPAETHDGKAAYRLAASRRPDFAAGDARIFGEGLLDPSAPWAMAVFSVPENQRAQRVRLKKTLAEFGFGVVSAGVCIAPGAIAADAAERLDHLGLGGFVEWFEVSPPAAGDRERVGRWWDLDGIAARYRRFIDDFAALAEQYQGVVPDADASAFARHLLLVTGWRELPYSDPGLPPALLPDDWPGGAARSMFRTLHATLAGPAERFAGLRDAVAPVS